MGPAFMRKYGVLTVSGTSSIRIPMIKRAVVDFALSADWTPAAGDVKIAIDGAAPVNITNLPTAVTSGNGAYWEFIPTAAELTCKQAIVTIVDAATKAVEDNCFLIETFGNASAMYPADFTDGVRLGLTGLANAAAGASGGLPTIDASLRTLANVGAWNGHAVPAENVNGVPKVDTVDFLGQAVVLDVNNLIKVDVQDWAAAVVSALPANFGALAITAGGAVTVGTNNDKGGYSLTTAPPTASAIATQVWQDAVAGGDFSIAGSIGKLLSTTLVVTVGGYSSGQDPATLVLDVAASAHNIASSIGAKINAAGAAADPWATQLPASYAPGSAGKLLASAGAAADPLANPVPGSYASGSAGAALGKLGGMNVVTVNPVAQSGLVTIVRGDDYRTADARALAFVNVPGTWPNLTAGTVTLNLRNKSTGAILLTTAGAITAPTGPNQTVTADLTAAQTTALPVSSPANPLLYDVVATLSNGHVTTLQLGDLVVAQNATN